MHTSRFIIIYFNHSTFTEERETDLDLQHKVAEHLQLLKTSAEAF